MGLFYVRIVFFINKKYEFEFDEKLTRLIDNDVVWKISVDQREEFINSKVVIISNGFKEKEAAEYAGKRIFYSVKKKFITMGIPINISGGLGVLDTTQTSFSTGEFTEHGLKYIHLLLPQLRNKIVRNEVLGMVIYEFEENIVISDVTFIAQDVQVAIKMKLSDLEIGEYPESKKLDIAYSLLNSSNAINDLRTSFLLKVSAIESLVSADEYNDKVYCNTLNKLNKLITIDNLENNSELTAEAYLRLLQKIKSAIGLLKKKSINEKCIDLISSYSITKRYIGLEAPIFFNKCYGIRSEFVHTGTYGKNLNEEQKIRNLEEYNIELQKLVIDILEHYEIEIVKKTNSY